MSARQLHRLVRLERLSLGVSVVLLLLYAANLIYTLVTRRHLFAGEAPSGQAEWVLPGRCSS
jgi:Ca2+:H+ antiporter